MTGGTGLQRFVRGSGPPAATTAPADGRAEAADPQPGQPAPEKCEMCATPVPASTVT